MNHARLATVVLVVGLALGPVRAKADKPEPSARWDDQQYAEVGRAFAASPMAEQQLVQISNQSPDPIAVSIEALDRLLDALQWGADHVKTAMGVEAIAEQGLKNADSRFPGWVDPFSQAHDFIKAMGEDIAQAPSVPSSSPWAVLSSHTLEQGAKLGLDWVLDDSRLKNWVASGDVADVFARRIGYVAYGADDIAAAVGQIAGGGRLDNPEVVGRLLDGLNKAAWGAVGMLLSDGNRGVGDTFAEIAGDAAQWGRDLTLDAFVGAYMKNQNIGQTLLDQYIQLETARVARGLAAQSFEELYGFDPQLVGAVEDGQRRAADARFGITDPARRTGDPALIVTRTWSESYRQVCQAGICVLSGLTINHIPQPVTEEPPSVTELPKSVSSVDTEAAKSLGGIDLSIPARAAAVRLPPITAVVLDPATNSVVFVGPAKASADGIKVSDLAMTIWLTKELRGQPIQFSLDPADPAKPENGRIKALYIPDQLKGHSAGAALFAADLLLKDLAFGVRHDAEYHATPWKPPVDGFTSYADLAFQTSGAAAASEQWARFWIVVSDMTVKGDAMAISPEPRMAVKALREVPDPSSRTGLRDVATAPDALEARWADLATANFVQLSAVSPELSRTRQLAAAVACAKWLDEQGVRIDMKAVADILNADRTPTIGEMGALSINRETERRVQYRSASGRGVKIQTRRLHIMGGVDLVVDPKFVADDGSTRRLYNETINALRMAGPGNGIVTFADGDEKFKAVALPLLMGK